MSPRDRRRREDRSRRQEHLRHHRPRNRPRPRGTVAHSRRVGLLLQQPRPGTGLALIVAREALLLRSRRRAFQRRPLRHAETVADLRDFHLAQETVTTMVAADLGVPPAVATFCANGNSNRTRAIVEARSSSTTRKRCRQSIPAICDRKAVPTPTSALLHRQPPPEYYLTDMASNYRKAKAEVMACKPDHSMEVLRQRHPRRTGRIDGLIRLAIRLRLVADGAAISYPEPASSTARSRWAPIPPSRPRPASRRNPGGQPIPASAPTA